MAVKITKDFIDLGVLSINMKNIEYIQKGDAYVNIFYSSGDIQVKFLNITDRDRFVYLLHTAEETGTMPFPVIMDIKITVSGNQYISDKDHHNQEIGISDVPSN